MEQKTWHDQWRTEKGWPVTYLPLCHACRPCSWLRWYRLQGTKCLRPGSCCRYFETSIFRPQAEKLREQLLSLCIFVSLFAFFIFFFLFCCCSLLFFPVSKSRDVRSVRYSDKHIRMNIKKNNRFSKSPNCSPICYGEWEKEELYFFVWYDVD